MQRNSKAIQFLESRFSPSITAFPGKCMLLLFLLSVSFTGWSQGRYEGDAMILNRHLYLKQVPDMAVWDKFGQQHKLNEYIINNQFHEGSPYAIAGIGFSGDSFVKELDSIATSEIPGSMNILILAVGNETDMPKTGITSSGRESKWGRCLQLKTTWAELQKMLYLTSYPYTLYADKKLQVVTLSSGNKFNKERMKKNLEGIQKGELSATNPWYDDNDELAAPGSKEAVYSEEYKQNADRVVYKKFNREKVLEQSGYIRKSGSYYFDGVMESQFPNGQKSTSGEFKEGIPVKTLRGWYPDGKIRFQIPVNGTAKTFDSRGNIEAEWESRNGLGNGKYFSYGTDGKIINKYNLRDGIQYGLQEIYSNGKLAQEYYVLPEFEDLGPITEGLQRVKMGGLWGYADRTGVVVIKPGFLDASDFKKGVAEVKDRNNKDAFINKKGKVISEREAEKIREEN